MLSGAVSVRDLGVCLRAGLYVLCVRDLVIDYLYWCLISGLLVTVIRTLRDWFTVYRVLC